MYHIDGLNRLGDEIGISQLLPKYSIPSHRGMSDFRIGIGVPAPPILNDLNTPQMNRKVLGKQVADMYYVSHANTPSTDGMVAHQGYGRHHQKGLAWDGRSLNAPLMPLADSDFGHLNSKIPQPK